MVTYVLGDKKFFSGGYFGDLTYIIQNWGYFDLFLGTSMFPKHI
jgi:hypothetical protein